MKEKIEISNFAGISYLEIELNAINILIGPQASGKSVTVKLFYFFKSVFSMFKIGGTELVQKDLLAAKFDTYFPLSAWGNDSFQIRYSVDEFWIVVQRKTKAPRLNISFSETFKKVLGKFNALAKTTFNKERDLLGVGLLQRDAEIRATVLSGFRKQYDNMLTANQIFIPAGRSFFANLQSNIFTLLTGNQVLDPILLEFGSYYELIKSSKNVRLLNKKKEEYNKKLNELINSILHGRYVVKEGEDFLIHDNGRNVHINFASSGQQEVLPLALFLQYIMKARLFSEKNEYVIYIEEPEAHLFPQSQKSMVDALALLANASKAKFQLIITTHSPYILSSFNNLIEAGNVLSENPDNRDKLFEVVDEKMILKYEDINAYSLYNGYCESIMDNEMKLISPTILDEASNDISVQFGKLLDL